MTKEFGIFTGFCLGCSVLSAAMSPNLYPFVIGAWGGAMGGAAMVGEVRRKKESEAVESAKVATMFTKLYEINKGIVSPTQLSVSTGVPLDKTTVFLDTLCENQKGKHITSPDGDVYNFPHPNNILEQLTNNAQAWVKSQTDPLLQENANLKAELSQLSAYLMRQQTPQQQPILNNSEEPTDPWNKLL